MNEKNQVALQTLISAVGTYLVLLALGLAGGGVQDVLHGLRLVASGDPGAYAGEQRKFLGMIAAIVAAAVLQFPVTAVVGLATRKILGTPEEGHAVAVFLHGMQGGNNFLFLLAVMVGEEVFARGIFLGLLPRIPWLAGTSMFYVLVLVGNGLWAYAHLWNFKVTDRNWGRTVPTFVGGLFFTIIFVKYGLFASVLGHFVWNVLAFSLFKVKKSGMNEVTNVLYAALCMAASYGFMGQPISDTLSWFTDQPLFVLPGWGVRDYMMISIFMSACLSFAAGILCYDNGDSSIVPAKIKMTLGASRYKVYLAIWGLSFWALAELAVMTDHVPERTLVVAMLLACIQKGASGSSLTRTLLTRVPDIFISLCVFQLGWEACLGWVAARLLLHVPRQAGKLVPTRMFLYAG